ncbi:peptidase inhibitor family I36 protein [Kutzneria sp. CA-103260]|uniref:peptidase inhibitor family I36 protein n=1 Tax=Kutzneria sp. CA-103260 TaxID=2802641 RepID=UPI001BA4C0DB|nr:peptidase inhibitor family I36 protein [Kutzneria sp. CA-103260]QUQ64749.1 Peptidase inhibitor family I36 [Kutzneria sp. CA-103260]
MRKLISKVLIVAAAVSGLAVTAALPASAAPTCPAGHSCFWSGANYTGYKWDDGGHSTPNWGAVHYTGTNIPLWGGDGLETNVSSMINRDVDSYVSIYYNSGYHGPCAFVVPNGNVPDFRRVTLPDGTPMNDRMNSHRYNDHCSG